MATTQEQVGKAIVPFGVAVTALVLIIVALSVLVGVTCF